MADVDIRAAWWGCAWFRASRGGVWGLAKYGLWVGGVWCAVLPGGGRLPRWGCALAPGVRWVGARGPAGVTPRRLERPNSLDATGASVACGETPTCPRARAVGGFPAAVAGVFYRPLAAGPMRPPPHDAEPPRPLRMRIREPHHMVGAHQGDRSFSSPHRPAHAEPTGGGVQGDTPRRRPLHGCVQT
ncbi:hypothetical protein CTZ40_08745 [Streptomyces rimosus]|nr:hypothetical protein CTZ40_08745 [Streptomyces rimosus]